MVATPHFYVEPTVLVGTVEVQCHISMVTLIPEVTWGDVETYCNPGGEAPTRISWRGVMRLRMSYGTDSSWELFASLDPTTPTDMTIWPGDAGTDFAGSSENPSADFQAYIAPLPFIPEHEVGASATFDIEFRVVGEPVFDDGTT